ncbi:MAG TPA: family 10 glycosylhydrolase [Lacunisphaera sp.]
MRSARSIFAALAIVLLAGCSTVPKIVENPPPAPREFRGVWVASVANIDWPSATGLSAAQLQAETIAILDRAKALNLNAIILQVRPAADALYPSSLEPWSEYLSGKQGGDPGYDPLKFWVEEAHRRGLQLHAWFNPYRARHFQAKSGFAATHIAKTHPASVKQYGDYWWMDPGDAFASRRTVEVVADVVQRYDVDGVHIDDYFYPYPIPVPNAPKPAPGEPAANIEFPDEPSWKLYRESGGKLSRAGWRRQNVDQLVERLNRAVHQVKPHVLFGVSPFGLGRPDRRPAGITGFSQYDQLYADVERWLENGWLDYLAPQLYWPRDRKGQEFAVLLDYWQKQNTAHRHLWPGFFTSSINDTPKSWTVEEILAQIDLVRAAPAATGHIHYSMIALQQDRKGISTRLQAGPNASPALVPATPWLDAVPPPPPVLKKQRDGKVLIQPAKGEAPASFAVWRRHGAEWRFSIQLAAELTVAPAGAEAVVVSAVDRLGNESPRVALTLVKPKKS